VTVQPFVGSVPSGRLTELSERAQDLLVRSMELEGWLDAWCAESPANAAAAEAIAADMAALFAREPLVNLARWLARSLSLVRIVGPQRGLAALQRSGQS
jgi:hypothetical protein